jgi:hypothetical protein
MYQTRIIWATGVLAAVLIVAACDREKEPTQPARTEGTGAPASLREFKQQLSVSAPTQSLHVNEKTELIVTVNNISNETWPATGDPIGAKAVHLAYHWLDKGGNLVVLDGHRTTLPRDLAPGETVSLNAVVQAPDRAGDFTLRLSMVQEAVAWFDERGGQPLDIPVTVRAQ